LSIVLIDWSVRESFHVLNYLAKQTIPREQYEIIWVEFYSRREAMRYDADKFIILGFPKTVYYHKHLMYNAGIIHASGDLVCFCDSDAILGDNFVDSILSTFDEQYNTVLHLDQVRNQDRKFYPFNYPKMVEVFGKGCSNWRNGTTVGLADRIDYIHSRNYGSTMIAWRSDLIRIGGADEHLDYLGYICGPYDMTFRLVNAGLNEIWHRKEFTYHVWHPNQGGKLDRCGPHDGRAMSTRALNTRKSKTVFPAVENQAIKSLRLTGQPAPLVNEQSVRAWRLAS
jgi:hypothetical protein